MAILPMFLVFLAQAIVSCKRINKYMNLDEILPKNATIEVNKNAIEITKASFKWNASDEEPYLKSIDVQIKEKSLVAVVGTVGSGKSSLISAILGEMQLVDGNIALHGSLGYCAQQAWIQNATIRDNILFHKKFEEDWYNQVIEACSLKHDLDILPSGDATEIGEKGINLSG